MNTDTMNTDALYIALATRTTVDEHEIRASAYPSILPAEMDDELLDELGFAWVETVEPPAVGPRDTLTELPPELIDGVWRQRWSVTTEPEPESVVPDRVTMRQARLALHGAGILPQVQPAIGALSEPARTVAQIEWDYSSEVFRNREFVNMMGSQLGLTNEQLDQLFIQAATL